MKKLIALIVVLVLAFGCYASWYAIRQRPVVHKPDAEPVETAVPVPAASPAAATPAATAPAETGEPAESAAPIVIPEIDMDAVRALHTNDEAVITLGDEKIDWKVYTEWLQNTVTQIDDYFHQMAAYYGMAASWDGSVGDGSGMTYAQYAVHENNEGLADVLAYRAFAAEQGVTLTQEEQAALEPDALAAAILGEGKVAADLEAELAEEGMSLETYRMIQETNNLLHKAYAERYGEQGEKVSEEEAVQYLGDQGYLSASHILFMTIDPNTGDALDEAVVAEKLAKAEELVKELRGIQNEEELVRRFGELKVEYCEDGGKVAYPDGYTFLPGTMVPEFESTIQGEKDYEVSDPIKTAYGYHIILRLPLRGDALLYSMQGTPTTARQEIATRSMNDALSAFVQAHPVTYAEGIEDLDLMKFIKAE